MNGAKKLTHILSPLFLGLLIGGAIFGNTPALVWGIVLLILDVIAGCVLQYMTDRRAVRSGLGRLSDEEKRALEQAFLEEVMQDMRRSGMAVHDEWGKESDARDVCEIFEEIYIRLNASGGARLTETVWDDEAGRFLLEVCEDMPHAPRPNTVAWLCAVSVEDLNGEHALVYSFKYAVGSICQNVFIFLVHTHAEKLRLFAVETHYAAFVLCEYVDNRHVNYGRIELKFIPTRIKELLKEEDA